jgi:hypothetical protein
MSSPVLTKEQNYRLWQGGAYGNRLRAWRSFREWYDDAFNGGGFYGLTVMRQLGRGGGGRCAYDLCLGQVPFEYGRWVCDLGVPREDVMFNEASPRDRVVVQGEYLNDVRVVADGSAASGIFRHSTVRGRHMRDAMSERTEEASGLRADAILRTVMTPSSYEDWRVLLDEYPGHVLEVSVFDSCVGDLPDRNALVWEVRIY